ncbi:SAM-dependent methyltransferase, partial [Salmonella enterica subsp. enterica serovar Enteritidis]
SIHYPLIERDMKNLSDLSVYDSVISFNDSLCYLENEQELAQVFTEVYKVLKNDGLFLFDVHSIYQMELFKDFSFHSELKNTVFIWDSFE